MVASIHFNTDAVAPRERAPVWCEWIHDHFGGLDSNLYGDTGFDGRIAASRAGEVVLTRLEANRHGVMRTRYAALASEQPYLKIVAPWQGSAIVQQQGREACARNGDWVAYDTTAAYEVNNPVRAEHLIVMVPKNSAAERAFPLDSAMARRLGASGISRVALETMRQTYLELPNMSQSVASAAGELIRQLVYLSLQELAGQENPVTRREALRDRIRAHVQAHLADPGLSVDSIAQALGCSRRQLYNVFTDDGESIAAHIQRLRLEACIRDLQQGSAHARPITDIALSWGFGNHSHFSRVFRGHTGMSPSEFRLGAAKGV